MRRLTIGAASAVYALIALGVVLVSALAFAGTEPPAAPVDATLDWVVKVALSLLAIGTPIQLWLGTALLGTLRTHGAHLARHDVQLAELEESKVYRRACEDRCRERQGECPARKAALARAAQP